MALSLWSCKNPDTRVTLDDLVLHYGGEKYYNSTISYTVNNFKYEVDRDGYRVGLSLIESNREGDQLKSILENGILSEYLNDSLRNTDSDNYLKKSHLSNFTYSNSIPFVLTSNDMEIDSVGFITKGTNKYQFIKVKTKFVRDIDINEFYLYIDPTTKDIMYVSQKFVTESKVPRIKRYYNHRTINGIRFADYTQFVAKEDTIDTPDLIKYFNAETLKPFSEIKFEDIEVIFKN